MKKFLIGHFRTLIIIALLFSYHGQSGATCWKLAENIYGIDAELLHAIALAESGMNNSVINKNKNGTYDIGLMQINSSHLPRLKYIGVTEELLLNEPCISLLVGASILNEMKSRYGTMSEAVGAYNAGTSNKRLNLRVSYANKVFVIYRELTGTSPW